MIEIQCTSCHTRYRIDERVLPDETPTFKCSRCGHVFNAEPVAARVRKPAPLRSVERPKPPPPQRAQNPEPEPEPERPTAPDPEPAPQPAPEPEPSPQPKFQAQPEPPVQPEPLAQPEPPARQEEPTPSQPAEEDNPLDRTFSRERSGDLGTGENLSFDFTSEPKPGEHHSEPASDESHEHSDDHWEVGEPADEPRIAEPPSHEPLTEPEPEEAPVPPKPMRQSPPRLQPEMPPLEEFRRPEFTGPGDDDRLRRKPAPPPDIPDEVAYFAAQRTTHSSAWFIGLFVVIALLFGGLSLAVHVQPAAAVKLLSRAPRVGQNFQAPMVPAMLVALHDVHADYQKVKGGQTALMISGTAENVGGAPLHAVLLAVDLLDDSGKQMASGAVYCGTGLSQKMVGEMTPREIEFLERLDPQKNFAVQPSQAAPFLVVFIDPPRKVANLRIQVAKAVAVQGQPTPRS